MPRGKAPENMAEVSDDLSGIARNQRHFRIQTFVLYGVAIGLVMFTLFQWQQLEDVREERAQIVNRTDFLLCMGDRKSQRADAQQNDILFDLVTVVERGDDAASAKELERAKRRLAEPVPAASTREVVRDRAVCRALPTQRPTD